MPEDIRSDLFKSSKSYELMEGVDFGQANACTVIGSAHDGGISSCGQVKHECRFQRDLAARVHSSGRERRLILSCQLSLLAMTEPLES